MHDNRWAVPLAGLILMSLAAVGCSKSTADATGAVVASPVLLLTKTVHHMRTPFPWAHYSDPEFVLYADGKVIFKREGRLSAVQLSAGEVEAWWGEYEIDAFLALDDSYSVDRRLDPPVHVITYWWGSRSKKVRLIGTLPGDPETPAPAALQDLTNRMLTYDSERARPYVPEQLAITALEASDAVDLLSWPQGWPDLNDASTTMNTGLRSESYTIVLNAEHRAEFERLYQQIETGSRIEMNQRHWYMTPKRFLLPNEAMWDSDARSKAQGEQTD